MAVGSDLTAELSMTHTEIIVRGYSAIYYWKRKPEETVGEVCQSPTKSLRINLSHKGRLSVLIRTTKVILR